MQCRSVRLEEGGRSGHPEAEGSGWEEEAGRRGMVVLLGVEATGRRPEAVASPPTCARVSQVKGPGTDENQRSQDGQRDAGSLGQRRAFETHQGRQKRRPDRNGRLHGKRTAVGREAIKSEGIVVGNRARGQRGAHHWGGQDQSARQVTCMMEMRGGPATLFPTKMSDCGTATPTRPTASKKATSLPCKPGRAMRAIEGSHPKLLIKRVS